MSKNIGVVGSGPVGQVLAAGFLKHGFKVMIGTNTPAKQAELRNTLGTGISTGSFAETAAFGQIVVLAVKGDVAEKAIQAAGAHNLKGKTVIDTTNPIAAAPPTNGVLHFFTSFEESLMEKLQRLVPDAHFVKSFSCVGNASMVNPDFGGVRPTMFLCGNNDAAKKEVKEILGTFGWDHEDMGKVEAARAIEPLCMLWCIPGFVQNRWSHAFKLLTK